MTVDDYKFLRKNDIIALLSGFGYPQDQLNDLSEKEKEELLDLIYYA